jgi:alpha-N-acetylglucosaminidase
MLTTCRGGNDTSEDYLHDYACKEWSGMMCRCYKKRWEMWFDHMRATLDGKTPERPNWYFRER